VIGHQTHHLATLITLLFLFIRSFPLLLLAEKSRASSTSAHVVPFCTEKPLAHELTLH
jgi:hypothetical protein